MYCIYVLTVIKKSNHMICQFASPVEIADSHKQPEVFYFFILKH